MSSLADAVAGTIATITALGALGTGAAGLVDASKAFGGGVSNFGLGYINAALKPFAAALDNATPAWPELVRASWINGMPKEDQKAATKSLIRLGLSAVNSAEIAAAGHVDAAALQTALTNIQSGAPSTVADVNTLGRLNGMIDAAMDAGYERADQQYRNASKVAAGAASVVLAVWAGQLMKGYAVTGLDTGHLFWPSVLAGLLAVPIAPIAKDLASSLQAAASAVQAVKR
ncbi:hypothetical protein [Phenylobacterium sp.]|jgi:hypothetical protein|uniref:hypothetical protein n=1 Tax=Phenylobacterium sp. TaxID=1871053 RepID=UPI002F3E6956